MKNYIYNIYEKQINDFKKKRHARAQVAKALKSGRLVKDKCCQRCKEETNFLSAHHVDYGKPLDIFWLCNKCHGCAHMTNSKLNPRNNEQTALCHIADERDTITVSITVPIKNYLVMRAAAESEKKNVSKLLRDNFMEIYHAQTQQLEFDLRVKRKVYNADSEKEELSWIMPDADIFRISPHFCESASNEQKVAIK